MTSCKKSKRSEPRTTQVRRLRWQHGLPERTARLVASLHYGEPKNG